MENVTAHENFFVLATMNPGGDYGKKELSPALRNRFTEIWVPSVSNLDELGNIALQRFVFRKYFHRSSSYKCSLLHDFDPSFIFLQNCKSRTFIFGGSYAKFLGGEFCFLHS